MIMDSEISSLEDDIQEFNLERDIKTSLKVLLSVVGNRYFQSNAVTTIVT